MGFFVLAIIATAVVVFMSRESFVDGKEIDAGILSGLVIKWGLLFFVLAFGATVATQSIIVVPPGHRGVVFNRISGIKPEVMGEGLGFVLPMVETVYLMDVRVQKDTADATAASKDLQTVHTKIALNYHPDPAMISQLYKNVGVDYSERLIQPAVQEAVKATTARFTAEELITHREEVKKIIQELVERYVSKVNIKVDELYITDFDFSRQFAEAIESKQVAEQQAFKAKRDLDRVKIEAEQKVASAKAEAEGLRMQKEAITPQLIELRKVEMQREAIQKWDGHMPNVMMGGTATPLLDLNALSRGAR